jgi:hypothetical protein
MKGRISLLLLAVQLVVISLMLGWPPRVHERVPLDGVWQYAAPNAVAGGRASAAAEAAANNLVAQCLWPRAIRSDAAGASRGPAVTVGIGHAFCLRVPGPGAHRDADAPPPPRASYRT